jgi:photosystem II stability/assembly factor-like uncharacterized protein
VEAAILVDATARVIYIGTLGGGVYKSTDGGLSFDSVNHGLDAHSIAAMAMSLDNPNIVYASTLSDVYKTVDGGASWIHTFATDGVVSLAMDPSDPNTVYAGSAPGGGVIKTIDGGATWTDASDGIGAPSVFAIAIDPRLPSVLYVGTVGLGAFKSTNGGATWTALNIDSSVWSMLVDPIDSNIVYAGTNGNSLYKSTNGGASFAPVGSPEGGIVLAIAKTGERLYAGTASHGVSVSLDGGKTWRNTGASDSLGNSLTVDSAGAVYLGTGSEGAFVRSVGDPVWRRLGWNQLQRCACQNGHAITVDPGDPDHLFLTTNSGGLLVTEDGGRTWRDGGVHGFISPTPRGMAFDPQQPRRVYAGSFTGGGLFKSEDHGKHWQRVQFGSSLLYTTGVAVDPVDHSIYVATIDGEGVWKSNDYGDTFKRIDRGVGAAAGAYLGLAGRSISIDPNNHRTIYFADNRGGTTGIWRSPDAGRSWVQVETAATISVTVDPIDSTRVFAGTSDGTVLRSTDGGWSFTDKSVGLPLDGIQASRTGSIQINPLNPNVLYVGLEGNGIYRSTDGAETWSPFNQGLDKPESLFVTGLAMAPDAPDTLYIATSASVYKISDRAR